MRSLNTLFVLSPLSPSLLTPETCSEAAFALKKQGTTRADITMDPRLKRQGPAHHRRGAMPDFLKVSQNLSAIIMRPIVGQSDPCSLEVQAITQSKIRIPNLPALSGVGKVFVQKPLWGQQKRPEQACDASNLGLIFFLALHGRTPDNRSYNQVVFPDMTPRAHQALGLLGSNLSGMTLGLYGPVINLDGIRDTMIALRKNGDTANRLFH